LRVEQTFDGHFQGGTAQNKLAQPPPALSND